MDTLSHDVASLVLSHFQYPREILALHLVSRGLSNLVYGSLPIVVDPPMGSDEEISERYKKAKIYRSNIFCINGFCNEIVGKGELLCPSHAGSILLYCLMDIETEGASKVYFSFASGQFFVFYRDINGYMTCCGALGNGGLKPLKLQNIESLYSKGYGYSFDEGKDYDLIPLFCQYLAPIGHKVGLRCFHPLTMECRGNLYCKEHENSVTPSLELLDPENIILVENTEIGERSYRGFCPSLVEFHRPIHYSIVEGIFKDYVIVIVENILHCTGRIEEGSIVTLSYDESCNIRERGIEVSIF